MTIAFLRENTLQSDNKTKSTDFLPGKPSMDSMSRASNTVTATSSVPNASSTKTPDNASAHVIDLKNAPTTFADSPLLNEETQPEPANKTPKVAPVVNEISIKDTKQQDISPKPTDTSGLDSTTTSGQPTAAEDSAMSEKGVDDINLSETSPSNEEKHVDQPKKGKKFKWVLIILGVVVVLAIAAGAVYYITKTTGNPF